MAEQALLDRLKRYSKHCLTQHTDPDFAEAVYEAVDVIDGLLNDLQEALETIEQKNDVAEVRPGKWENDGIDRIGSCEIHWQKCSECGYALTKIPIQPLNKYCPNCGARMEDGE